MATKKSGIDQDTIRDLAKILTETDLTEIEVEQDDLRIRVSRAGVHTVAQAHSVPNLNATAAAETPQPSPASEIPARTSKNTIKSPMVGTSYLAPAPGAKPFIEVGQMVSEGQTIMIIEAMKTMNQIPAPRAGKVAEILVSDGQPVEYGEVLIVFE